MMRFIRSLCAIFYVLASAASAAETTPLVTLMTGNDSRGWEAVGRLNFGGRAFCTGSLIAPDLVLTAAHCLFDKENGRKFKAREIEFLAGWRNGRANASSGVSKVVVHPSFQFSLDEGALRSANDLALLRLSRPVRKSSVTPFETQTRPRKGDQVGVVSYARGRAESPSLQQACVVLARRSGTLILSCDVDFGSSGAPVFAIDDSGVARIVSVISAKAEISGRNVALGTSLKKPLADLMALMVNGETLSAEPETGVKVITLGGSSAGTGAKFVRP